MPCKKCNGGAWECGYDEDHLCQDLLRTQGDPWEEVGEYDGPTPVKVFLRKHHGKCQVRFEPV